MYKNLIDLTSDDVVVVAVSGGPDSMFLLSLLINKREKLNYTLICAHVNHGVRIESEEEQSFIKEYCKSFNIPFECHTIDAYNDGNFHQEARKIRYKFFDDVMAKYKGTLLLTAHHADDLMETILMRLVRGSTFKGYAGINRDQIRGNYKIVRPLLSLTKDEILNYVTNNNIPHRIDVSNEKSVYTRNRFRKEVISFLKKEYLDVHEKFLDFQTEIISADKYIESQLDLSFNDLFMDNCLMVDIFTSLDPFLQKRAIYRVLGIWFSNNLEEITKEHVKSMQKLILSNKANSVLNFPNNKRIVKAYSKILLEENKYNCEAYRIELKDGFTFEENELVFLDETNENNNNIIKLLKDEIKLPIYVRSRKDGDVIFGKGMNGKQKVKDIFINKKVPKDLRDTWPIVVDKDDNVLWIPKLKKSIFDKKNNEKYDIIIKCDYRRKHDKTN